MPSLWSLVLVSDKRTTPSTGADNGSLLIDWQNNAALGRQVHDLRFQAVISWLASAKTKTYLRAHLLLQHTAQQPRAQMRQYALALWPIRVPFRCFFCLYRKCGRTRSLGFYPVSCVVRQDSSPPYRSLTALGRITSSARGPSVLLPSARGVSQMVSLSFCQVGPRSSRAPQTPSCAASRVPTQPGSMLVTVDHSSSLAARTVLANSVPVDDVDASGAVQSLQGLKSVIAPESAPFFTNNIRRVTSVTSKFTRIPLSSAALDVFARSVVSQNRTGINNRC